jgi:hypothetical protein
MSKQRILRRWKKSARQEVRVTLGFYRGKHMVSVRVWYADQNRVYLPGKNGITLTIDHLPAMLSGLKKAQRRANKRKMLS